MVSFYQSQNTLLSELLCVYGFYIIYVRFMYCFSWLFFFFFFFDCFQVKYSKEPDNQTKCNYSYLCIYFYFNMYLKQLWLSGGSLRDSFITSSELQLAISSLYHPYIFVVFFNQCFPSDYSFKCLFLILSLQIQGI